MPPRQCHCRKDEDGAVSFVMWPISTRSRVDVRLLGDRIWLLAEFATGELVQTSFPLIGKEKSILSVQVTASYVIDSLSPYIPQQIISDNDLPQCYLKLCTRTES